MMDATLSLHGDDEAPRARPIAASRAKPGSIAGRSRESRQFWILYALTFPVFLVAALIMRVLRLGQSKPQRSRGFLSEAHELASASIPYAFMG